MIAISATRQEVGVAFIPWRLIPLQVLVIHSHCNATSAGTGLMLVCYKGTHGTHDVLWLCIYPLKSMYEIDDCTAFGPCSTPRMTITSLLVCDSNPYACAGRKKLGLIQNS